jgi:hypothetical protein
MTLFGLIGLLVFVYMRPHEFVLALAALPFLYLFLGIIAIGIGIELGSRRARFLASPQLPLVLLFWVWCLLTLALQNAAAFSTNAINVSVAVTLYLVVAHGIQSVPRFAKITLVIFGLGLFVAGVTVHQGLQPFTCLQIIPGTENARATPTGTLCPMIGPSGEKLNGQAKCEAENPPGFKYLCEKPGLFATTSVMGRVRYLGRLQDPNEVALATSMAVPFAFSFLELKRSMTRLLLLFATMILVGVAVIFSQSRGGLVAFTAVLGAYFMKKYGYKRGILIAAGLAVPLLVLGGRGGEEAEESSMIRFEAWAAGIKMFLSYPITGVGYGQFTEHHGHTAHNAYILALGELGLPGMWLFITMLIASIKIPVAVLGHPTYDDEGQSAKSLAMAMLAAFGGAVCGIFFLSWSYHPVLWIHLGLSGALYATIKARDPSFEVRTTWRDVLLALGIALAILVGLVFETKRKGAW